MKYQPDDILVYWTKQHPFSWGLVFKRPLKFLQEFVWAPFVRLVAGPIHVTMIAVGGDTTEEIRQWDVPAPKKPFRDDGVPGSPHQHIWYWAHEIAIYRSTNWDVEVRVCMRREWERMDRLRIRYGYVRQLAHLADWLLGIFGLIEIFLFRRIFKGGPTFGRECSNHVANRVWVCARQDFNIKRWGRKGDAADPGDIDEFCRTSGKYETVLARTAHWRNA